MSSPLREVLLSFDDPEQLRELSGELGRNLRVIGRELGVRVDQRGSSVTVAGDDGTVDLAARVIEQLYELAGGGVALTPSTVDHACRIVRQDPTVKLQDFFHDVVLVTRQRKPVFPRSFTQRVYVDAIRRHDIVFGIGPAGTGKTYLAMAMAVAALSRNEVSRIVLCRPAVEAGEKLGFLPGDMNEKVNPYLRPLLDALHDMVDADKAVKLQEKGIIEIAPLAFMRGRTLSDAFIILDEAQNTTSEQMKMFLTRLGLGSKAVITGDPTQVDLPYGKVSGLAEARKVLSSVPQVAMVDFGPGDVVRHPLVAAVIRAYDRYSRGGEESSA